MAPPGRARSRRGNNIACIVTTMARQKLPRRAAIASRPCASTAASIQCWKPQVDHFARRRPRTCPQLCKNHYARREARNLTRFEGPCAHCARRSRRHVTKILPRTVDFEPEPALHGGHFDRANSLRAVWTPHATAVVARQTSSGRPAIDDGTRRGDETKWNPRRRLCYFDEATSPLSV